MNLHCSVYEGDLVRTQHVLRHGRGKNSIKSLALVLAASMGHGAIVKEFIKAKTDINNFDIVFNYQRTWETRNIKKLHRHWQLKMLPFTRGWSPRITPLCAAAFLGHTDVVQMLVDAGALLDKDPYSEELEFEKRPAWNALTCALFGGNDIIAEYLMLMGASATDMSEAAKPMAILVLKRHRRLPLELIDIMISYI